MDLTKMANDKKLYLCKWYFRAGFVVLPFLWVVNAIWFFKQAFVVPEFEEQKQIRRYVFLSAIGGFISLSALLTWIVIFQRNRVAWGEFGDSLTYIYPAGIP